MPDLDPQAREFLTRPVRYATLATIDPDGSPLLAVVWYLLEDDGTILLNSRVGRRWPANLLRDPRAALSVEDGDDYVAVRGVAERLREGEAAYHDIATLARRYSGGEDLEARLAEFRSQERISFRLRPRSVTIHH